jgi:hypothetical protein
MENTIKYIKNRANPSSSIISEDDTPYVNLEDNISENTQNRTNVTENQKDSASSFNFTNNVYIIIAKKLNKIFFTETFSIDMAVEKMGFGRFQMKLSLLTGLAWVIKTIIL